jgi:predicted TIM-barrel enzyme
VLGLLGTGASDQLAETGTDIIAHAFGFVTGGVLGVVVAQPVVALRVNAVPQWMSGTLTLALVAIAWSLTLLSGSA